jgi:hypothetical protein
MLTDGPDAGDDARANICAVMHTMMRSFAARQQLQVI